MKLHDLKPAPGSHTPARRVGRGHGSGRGKTAGRGTKGQKSRAGASIPAWFEGGQTPLHVRTPKLHGFRNRGRVEYAAVNLGALTDAEAGTLITPDVLLHDGIVRRSKSKALPVKILGSGDAPTRCDHPRPRVLPIGPGQADRRGLDGPAHQLARWQPDRRGSGGEGRRRSRRQGRGQSTEAKEGCQAEGR